MTSERLSSFHKVRNMSMEKLQYVGKIYENILGQHELVRL